MASNQRLESQNLKINQSAFIQYLLESENMNNCNSVHIPIKADYFIEISESDNYNKSNLKGYQRLIRKLMYLSCGIRPDIAFIIG